MDEQDLWVWIGAGERQAINLRHIARIVLIDGDPPSARLSLTAGAGDAEVTVEGPEAVALRTYLHRTARHLEDLGAG